VYLTALRLLKDPTDGEDVLQDVFLGLPQAVAKYDGRGSFEGWLRRTATNLALMVVRSRKTRREEPLGGAPADRILMRNESIVERIAIEEALDTLPEKQRVVFVLKEMEGYSHPEIAQLLSISNVASRSRYLRAMRHLRTVLGDGR
jgi:RNA polymerase sigma-70 factor (ECF subfamily)